MVKWTRCAAIFLTLVVLFTGCAGNGHGRPVDADRVIEALNLEPMGDAACPGFFRPTYASDLRADMEKDRAAASLIYYLMTDEMPVDPWHILTSDEILLYHAGAPMIQLLLYEDGTWEEVVLGPDIGKGHIAQKLIPAGTWMGFVKEEDSPYDWGLYGVMVVPAWHIDDIRMVEGKHELEVLEKKFPSALQRGKELGLF